MNPAAAVDRPTSSVRRAPPRWSTHDRPAMQIFDVVGEPAGVAGLCFEQRGVGPRAAALDRRYRFVGG